jgi:hypothetical protein
MKQLKIYVIVAITLIFAIFSANLSAQCNITGNINNLTAATITGCSGDLVFEGTIGTINYEAFKDYDGDLVFNGGITNIWGAAFF